MRLPASLLAVLSVAVAADTARLRVENVQCQGAVCQVREDPAKGPVLRVYGRVGGADELVLRIVDAKTQKSRLERKVTPTADGIYQELVPAQSLTEGHYALSVTPPDEPTRLFAVGAFSVTRTAEPQ